MDHQLDHQDFEVLAGPTGTAPLFGPPGLLAKLYCRLQEVALWRDHQLDHWDLFYQEGPPDGPLFGPPVLAQFGGTTNQTTGIL